MEALRAHQFERLKTTIAHVLDRVPRYREKLTAAGVGLDDLTSLDDLVRFPFTTKDDLRACYPFGMFAAPMEDIVRLHVSSGTTGKPTVVGYTAGDIDRWADIMARSLQAVGVGPADLVHIAFGYGLFTGGLGWHYGVERLGATVIPASGGFTDRQVDLMRDFRPTVLLATPSYALVIADAFAARGFDPADCGLRTVICGAEPWSEGMRAEIEARFRVEAYDSYGLSEVIGPGVAQERAGDKGALTIFEDHFYPEVVDPETGAIMPEGEPGEAVFTSLTKEGFPVIRYRTRDLTRLLPPVDGPMRRIARVAGRSDDMLIIRGVNVFPSQIEAILTGEPRLAPCYLLEIRRRGRLDELTVKVETRTVEAAEANGGDIGRHAERLIKDHVGVGATVVVVPPGTIERSQGKARRVVDLRPAS
ncbi:phenylacetate--CoA ligase family protein [Bauldia litoralis]|uniref:Phenylacetate-coenzyme A ligase n=1 Tax=Bauldia litoralis TaxID=665467 RepID=A0A1G6DTK1_9HYPH|nr:AMP-binding protein [Bauldia litoralis]SDB48494.1 phenylacetate-CoA ligase [Bauldia litoralis]